MPSARSGPLRPGIPCLKGSQTPLGADPTQRRNCGGVRPISRLWRSIEKNRSFWTRRRVKQSRIDLALNPAAIRPTRQSVSLTCQPGPPIFEGAAASQGGWLAAAIKCCNSTRRPKLDRSMNQAIFPDGHWGSSRSAGDRHGLPVASGASVSNDGRRIDPVTVLLADVSDDSALAGLPDCASESGRPMLPTFRRDVPRDGRQLASDDASLATCRDDVRPFEQICAALYVRCEDARVAGASLRGPARVLPQ